MSQLATLGYPNNWDYSVIIPTGLQVILYSEDNFTGASLTFTANSQNLKVSNFDNAVLSVKINLLSTPVESVFSNNDIIIYPNPLTDFLHVGGVVGVSQVTIRNTTDQIILATQLTGSLDVRKLTKGIYFLIVNNSN